MLLAKLVNDSGKIIDKEFKFNSQKNSLVNDNMTILKLNRLDQRKSSLMA